MTYPDDEIVDSQIQLQANVYLNHILTNDGALPAIYATHEKLQVIETSQIGKQTTAVETQNDGAASNE